jgi:hypothetical protein
MAPTSKDIKELMAARKARRAIPQTDPAEVVASPPEPELAGPPQQAEESPAPEQEVPMQPPTGSVVAPALDDPRTQRVPARDSYVVTSIKIKEHQQRQLKAEAYHRDLRMQDIIETALEEYFRKRYGRQGRGQSR